jgi:outer membrane protein
MNKLVIALTAALALAPAARAADFKAAVVDFQRAGLETDEGKAIAQQLAEEMKSKQSQLDAKQNELKQLAEDFDKQAALLNDQTKAQKRAELQRRDEEVRSMFMQLQQELGQREQEASRGMSDRLRKIVADIAAADNIKLVVDRQAVIWNAAGLDITEQVISKYNDKFPYKGGSGGGAGGGKGGTKPAGAKTK